MFSVCLINFGYSIFETKNINKAIDKAKQTGYTCSIIENGEVIAEYSPIGGLRMWSR
jgi:hypothetical protein